MKKIILILLLITSSIILIGCNQKVKKVAILIYDQEDTFMKEYLDEVISYFKSDVSYEISYANKSQATQNRQFNDYIDRDFDLFIINAVDRLASETLIDKSNKLELPVIFINREPTDALLQSKYAYYVGADSIGMGHLQAEMIYNDFVKGKVIDRNQDELIQTIIFKGEQGHQDAENRTKMVIEGLKELGLVLDVLEIKVANWDRLSAYEYMSKIMDSFNNIELIISNNDDMALGAIDYLKEINKMNLPVYGVDRTILGKEAVDNYEMNGTVFNDYVKQAQIISKYVNYLLYDIKDNSIDYTQKFNYINGNIYQN